MNDFVQTCTYCDRKLSYTTLSCLLNFIFLQNWKSLEWTHVFLLCTLDIDLYLFCISKNRSPSLLSMKHSHFKGLYVISSRSNFLCSLVVYVCSIYEPCLYDSFYVLMALYILENIRKICKAHRFIQLHFPDYTLSM